MKCGRNGASAMAPRRTTQGGDQRPLTRAWQGSVEGQRWRRRKETRYGTMLETTHHARLSEVLHYG
eukprot:1163156-Amphidinium_carterae.1